MAYASARAAAVAGHDRVPPRAVRDAILQTAAELVAEHGLRAVTMSQVAERAGIGRATLYKYLPDVEAMLLAWHERQVAAHLDELRRLHARPGPVGERLAAVLEAYALIHHRLAAHHQPGRPAGGGAEIAALLHRGAHVDDAQRQLERFARELLGAAAAAGAVRGDVPPAELAGYRMHALAGASRLRSRASVSRLVEVTLAGLGHSGRRAPPAAGARHQRPAHARSGEDGPGRP